MFFDIGKFVGRYFQLLAILYIAWLVYTAIFLDSLMIDFSFLLLLWAATYLIQHNPTARNWTIALLAIFLVGICATRIIASFVGTERINLHRGGRPIRNPSFGLVALVAAISATILGFPLALLLTPRARREFQTSSVIPP